ESGSQTEGGQEGQKASKEKEEISISDPEPASGSVWCGARFFFASTPLLRKRGCDQSGQSRGLNQRGSPVLQSFLDLVQELVGDGTVDHRVVVAQCDVAHGANGDRVVDHDRSFFNRPEAKNADIRLADHGQAEEAAEYAGVGDRERAFLNFFRAQLLGA